MRRGRIYANMDELYADVAPEEEEDPYGYGDESIYDSICYYQAPVSYAFTSLIVPSLLPSLSLSPSLIILSLLPSPFSV